MSPDATLALLASIRRAALTLLAAYQLDLVDALANGPDLSPLYAADDLTTAADRAREEMRPVEREPIDPYFSTALAAPIARWANGGAW